MTIFKVTEELYSKYHGAGYALAASLNGKLVDLVYVEDVLPWFDGLDGDIKSVLSDARLGPTVRMLQALGDVHVGMCSCYEFVEL